MRRLLIFTGEHDWCIQQARQFLGNWTQTLWISTSPDNPGHHQPSDAIRFLGQEFKAVIYDMRAGFNPDAFGALSVVMALRRLRGRSPRR